MRQNGPSPVFAPRFDELDQHDLAPRIQRRNLNAFDFLPSAVSTARLFVAVDPPATLREQLTALYESIRGVTWTRPEQLHLTLRFLGDIDEALAPPVEEALARIQVQSFILPLAGIGSFPPRGPARVIWTGTGTGHPRLYQLRQQIDDALLGTGMPLDVRTFQPHVTLGRIKAEAPPGLVSQYLKRHKDFEAPPFRVESVRLYASVLQPNGAVHTLKREFPLQPWL